MFKKSACLMFTALVSMMGAAGVHAADTTETFDIGATDFEFYLGFDGIGLEKCEKTISAETVVGYGFMDAFSSYLALAGESNEYFSEGSGGVDFAIFGTPVDTDHFDLDLVLGAGYGVDEFGVTPALELNFDLAPELAVWGIYLRIEETLAGRDESVEDDPTTPNTDESKRHFAFAPTTGLVLGGYWTLIENHQLLFECDMGIADNPADDEDRMEIGGVALGYNVALNDTVELINQVSLDIPQSGEDFAVGISTGLIITMPTAEEMSNGKCGK